MSLQAAGGSRRLVRSVRGRRLRRFVAQGVEREDELQYVHPGFSQESELAALGMFRDHAADVLFIHTTWPRPARELKCCGRRGDVRIQAGARGGHQIDWNLDTG